MSGRAVVPLAERFWAKVDKNGPAHPYATELGQCWLWTGGKVQDGYGTIGEGGRNGRHRGAHTVSYELANGVSLYGSGQHVMHSCDRRNCIRPEHLSLGTNLDNIRDCAAKGRTKDQRGSKHAMTKLTEADVVKARAAFWAGTPLKEICAGLRISKGTASPMVHGKTWTHVPMPPTAAAAHAALRERGIMSPAEPSANASDRRSA